MKLSARLSGVARHVLPGEPVADVGTDHGQLPVYLLLSGHVPRAIASDRRPQPLRNAIELGRARGLGDSVLEHRLSDGLAHLGSGEAATVTICGMGGSLMARILSAHPPQSCAVRRLVLQPNNAPEVLRQWLASSGWSIIDEELIAEGGYSYPIIVAEPGAWSPSEEDIWLGPVLRSRGSAHFRSWVRAEAARLSEIVERAQRRQRAESASLRRLQRRLDILETERVRLG